MTPKEATTDEKILELKRDNYSTKNYWILVQSDRVTLTKQKSGEESDGMITFSKKQFNRLIDFYQKEQN